jgi:hypothetical protein
MSQKGAKPMLVTHDPSARYAGSSRVKAQGGEEVDRHWRKYRKYRKPENAATSAV